MKNFATIFFFLVSHISIFSQISHDLWTELLQKHVSQNGIVNYKGFIQDSNLLNVYLQSLEQNYPAQNWSNDEVMAYWINAYNAYTVKLVTLHYPIKSIKEIGGKIPFVNSTWDIRFINIDGEKKDLNYIEHKILRKKFDDPRIHMALVCASKSCPILRNEAFTGDKLNAQLDDQSKNFLKDKYRNKITSNAAEISMIFKWYGLDFKKTGGVRAFVNKYSEVKINSKINIDHIKYDWDLNE